MSLTHFVDTATAIQDLLKKRSAPDLVRVITLYANFLVDKRMPCMPNSAWFQLRADGLWGDHLDFRGDERPMGKVYVRFEAARKVINISSIDLEAGLQRMGLMAAVIKVIEKTCVATHAFDKVMIQNITNDGFREFVANRPGWSQAEDEGPDSLVWHMKLS